VRRCLAFYFKNPIEQAVAALETASCRIGRSVIVSRYGTKLSVATLNRELAAVKGMFTWAVKIREIKIDNNPTRLA